MQMGFFFFFKLDIVTAVLRRMSLSVTEFTFTAMLAVGADLGRLL